MSDTAVTRYAMQVICTMQRGTDTTSRSFSIDDALYEAGGQAAVRFKTAAADLANFLTGEGNTLIQPTGWRDSDSTEAEWTTTSVEIKTISSVTTTLDLRQESNIGWHDGNNSVISSALEWDSLPASTENNGTYVWCGVDDVNVELGDGIKYTFAQEISGSGGVVRLATDDVNSFELWKGANLTQGKSASITASFDGDATYLPSTATLVITRS